MEVQRRIAQVNNGGTLDKYDMHHACNVNYKGELNMFRGNGTGRVPRFCFCLQNMAIESGGLDRFIGLFNVKRHDASFAG